MFSSRFWAPLGWVAFLFLASLTAQAGSDQAPRRVISLSPHFTEIVYDIGAGDRLVAVTDFCRFPSSARDLPKVGGFLDLNVETVVRMRPDVVLAVLSSAPSWTSCAARSSRSSPWKTPGCRRLGRVRRVGTLVRDGKKAESAKRRLQNARRHPTAGRAATHGHVRGGDRDGSLAQMTVAGRGRSPTVVGTGGFRNVFRDMRHSYLPCRGNPSSPATRTSFPCAPLRGQRQGNKSDCSASMPAGRACARCGTGDVFFITKDEWTIPGLP
jgi:hypothetical protein